MWIRTYSKTFSGIKASDIWKIWTAVNAWPTWHDDLEYCRLEGAFRVGNHFMLKPKGVPAVRIEITDIKEGLEFTDCTRFFGARMQDTHALEETSEGVKLTNTLRVTGPLKYLWIHLVAKHVADSIPQETEALVSLARSKR